MYYNYSPYFGYVKKEDAKEILKRRTVVIWVFAICYLFLFGTIEVFVFPRLVEISQEMSLSLPFYLQFNIRYTIYITLLATTVLVKPESGEEIDAKLKQYKSGEMILISKLVNKKYEYFLMAILFAVIAYLVFSVIVPIYDITATV